MGTDQRTRRGVHVSRWACAGLVAVALSSVPHRSVRGADPPDQQACLDSYTESQRLRKAGALKAARGHLLICSQDSCPSVVKADCVPWLGQVERALPTIVVAAKGADGNDTTEVRVSIDGELVAATLDGRPIPVDPGAHKLRFEHPGRPPIERTIVVQVAVKNRRVDVSFAPEPKPEPAPAPTRTPATPEQPPEERGEPVAGYILTGFGVLALGSFALFGLLGKSEADEYEETCAPTKTCDEDEVAATETKLIVADVSLIVGVVAVGVGVGLILYNKLSEPDSPTVAARLELRPVAGGATLGVSGAF